MWQLQLYCHVQPRAVLELAHSLTPLHSLVHLLARAHSNSLTFTRTRSPGAAKPLFSLASFMLFLK